MLLPTELPSPKTGTYNEISRRTGKNAKLNIHHIFYGASL
jgi:hypothetical protein